MPFCTACGNQNPDDARFCAQCGTRLVNVTSSDAGTTWTLPQQLNAVSMPLNWLADTSLGPMLGDYFSVSWVGGRPVAVFSVAMEPAGGFLSQATFATVRR